MWLPDLAPSDALLRLGKAVDDARAWNAFARRYRTEMSKPEAKRLLDLLAALSHGTDFAVGCYCADEARCHRSLLRELLRAHGAKVA